ncbi:ELL-associated factor 2 [Carex littledalei]|uniref:ELL-associated factor 2 n=1 Tax=Carex littledalei TaxID=544730 RepID=A0A833REF5_9POAL|nr:ELL-associated factor 2 [Carex littledalei]
MANGNGETSAGPQPNTWYPLRLGSSFVESSPSTKFCTLRYEFKPASIDKTQPGTLHKNKENRVSVEFHNNQPGKPKVAFEGSSEDYKETDAVLFFDGGEFKLEKLHRAFKSLKHKRVPGESNGLTGLSGACANGAGPSAEAHSPPLPKVARTQAVNRPSIHAMPVEVEKIDIGGPENIATRPVNNKTNTAHQPSNPNPFSPYNQDQYQDQDQDHDEHLDILGDDEPGTPNPLPSFHHTNTAVGFDINVPNHHAESDDDIDLFDDMPTENKGLSAAQALRAQVNGSGTGDVQFEQGAQGQETSSSGGESSTSGSSSASGSGSGSSSSSESDASDADGGGADSASSAGDIDIF